MFYYLLCAEHSEWDKMSKMFRICLSGEHNLVGKATNVKKIKKKAKDKVEKNIWNWNNKCHGKNCNEKRWYIRGGLKFGKSVGNLYWAQKARGQTRGHDRYRTQRRALGDVIPMSRAQVIKKVSTQKKGFLKNWSYKQWNHGSENEPCKWAGDSGISE